MSDSRSSPPTVYPGHALHIGVMGAGSVGSYYGGMLARAGHKVTLVARAPHVQAMQQHGLRLQTSEFDAQVQVQTSTEPSALSDACLVLLAVKSSDTQAAAVLMRPFLRPNTLVLCLQNGVDNAERVRCVLPGQPVAAAVVYVATEMAGPGHVRHHGRGELVIEPQQDRAATGSTSQPADTSGMTARPGALPVLEGEALAEVFRAAGVPVQVSDDVRGALWSKLLVNCAYNAVSAITQLPYGQTVQGVGVTQVMRDVLAECVAVAQADGMHLPGGPSGVEASVQHIAQSMPTQRSSTAQDLARGKPTEIDHLNGFIVQRGRALGVPTPANQVLWALVKLLESKAATS